MKKSRLEILIKEELQALLIEKEQNKKPDLDDIIDDLGLDPSPEEIKMLDRALQDNDPESAKAPLSPELKAILNRKEPREFSDDVSDFLADLDKSDSDKEKEAKQKVAKEAAVKKILENPQPPMEINTSINGGQGFAPGIQRSMSRWNPFPGLLASDVTPEAKEIQRSQLQGLMRSLKTIFQKNAKYDADRYRDSYSRQHSGLGRYASLPLYRFGDGGGGLIKPRRNQRADWALEVPGPSAAFITYIYFQAKYPDLALQEDILSGFENNDGRFYKKPVNIDRLQNKIKYFKASFVADSKDIGRRTTRSRNLMDLMFVDPRLPKEKIKKVDNYNPESDIGTMFRYYMRILNRLDTATGGALRKNFSFGSGKDNISTGSGRDRIRRENKKIYKENKKMNKETLIQIIKEEINKVLSERPFRPRGAAAAFDDLDAELANAGPGGTNDIAATPSRPQAKMPKQSAARERMKQRLRKANTAAQSQQDRARAVLQIVSPSTDAAILRMSGKGQKMFLNGVAIPPKYINYILKGGEMPK